MTQSMYTQQDQSRQKENGCGGIPVFQVVHMEYRNQKCLHFKEYKKNRRKLEHKGNYFQI